MFRKQLYFQNTIFFLSKILYLTSYFVFLKFWSLNVLPKIDQHTKSNLMIYNLDMLKKWISVIRCFSFFLISELEIFLFAVIFRSWSLSKKIFSNKRTFVWYITWPCSEQKIFPYTSFDVITFCIWRVSHFPCILKP